MSRRAAKGQTVNRILHAPALHRAGVAADMAEQRFTPLPLVTELSTGQDDRIARLMVEAAEQRVQLEALQAELDDANRMLALAAHDLATATGENATPQDGCRIVDVPITGGRMLVEIQTDGDDGIDLLNVFIGGHWIDVQDLHCATDLDLLRASVGAVLV